MWTLPFLILRMSYPFGRCLISPFQVVTEEWHSKRCLVSVSRSACASSCSFRYFFRFLFAIHGSYMLFWGRHLLLIKHLLSVKKQLFQALSCRTVLQDFGITGFCVFSRAIVYLGFRPFVCVGVAKPTSSAETLVLWFLKTLMSRPVATLSR